MTEIKTGRGVHPALKAAAMLTFGAIAIAPHVAIGADAASLPALCDQSGDQAASDFAGIFHNSPRFPSTQLQTGTAAEILSGLQAFCVDMKDPNCLAQAPWILMNDSRLEVRMASFQILQGLADSFPQRSGFSKSSATEILASAAAAPAQYSSATPTAVAAVIAAARANASNKISTQMPKDESYIDGICATFLDFGCPSAMKDIIQIGQVGTIVSNIDGAGGSTDLTAMNAIQTLFSDPKFSQGLAIAAERLLSRVADAQAGTLPTAHFLDDIEAGYQQAGYDAVTAQDMAFTYLAFYGARGASVEFVSPLATAENYPVFTASYLVAGAVGVLDSYTLQSGHPYSLPPNLSTGCAYGRPYHFWLAAYLARTLMGMGHSKTSSIIAAHISGVGYEATAGTVTRVPYEPLAVAGGDLSNDAIRLNIAMDDAGARFGAEIGGGQNPGAVDLDSRIVDLVNVSDPLSPLTLAQAQDLFTNHLTEYILRWDVVFQPNTDFLSIEF